MNSLAIRSATDADAHFIEETFLDSFRTAHTAGLIGIERWREVMIPEWQRLRSRPGVQLVVACHPGEEDTRADLYGWIAAEHSCPPPFVLYCYVKQAYRRMGLCRALLAAVEIDPESDFQYAAKTATSSKIVHRFPRASWNPLRARF